MKQLAILLCMLCATHPSLGSQQKNLSQKRACHYYASIQEIMSKQPEGVVYALLNEKMETTFKGDSTIARYSWKLVSPNSYPHTAADCIYEFITDFNPNSKIFKQGIVKRFGNYGFAPEKEEMVKKMLTSRAVKHLRELSCTDITY